MEQKRGERKDFKKGGGQAGSRSGCLKKGGAGTPLRTMDSLSQNLILLGNTF